MKVVDLRSNCSFSQGGASFSWFLVGHQVYLWVAGKVPYEEVLSKRTVIPTTTERQYEVVRLKSHPSVVYLVGSCGTHYKITKDEMRLRRSLETK
jgi:hypothetical protein